MDANSHSSQSSLWNRILSFYLYSSIHIAICASLFTAATYFILNETINFKYVAFVGFSTAFLYSVHREIGAKRGINGVQNLRFSWYYEYRNIVRGIAIISGLLSFFLFVNFPLELKVWIMTATIPSIGYVLPFSRKNAMRLRDVAYLKIFIVAFTWGLVSAVLPAYNKLNTNVLLLFLEKSSFIFAITLPFDFRDRDQDINANLNTIANQFSGRINQLIVLAFTLAILLVFVNPIYTISVKVGVVVLYILLTLITLWATKKEHDFYISGVIDFTMVLYFLGIYFLY